MQDPPADSSANAASQRRAALDQLAIDRDSRPLAARRRRLPGWLKFLVLLAVLVGGVMTFTRLTAARTVETATVLRLSPIREAEITTANGYVRARTRASVASATQGRLLAVKVEEGQAVAAGDLLAVVDHDEADAWIAQVQARLEAQRREAARADAAIDEASAAVRSVEAVVAERAAARDAAAARLAQASAEFDRVANLVGREIRSEADLDRARQARDVADADLRAAESAVGSARTEVERAKAAMASASYGRDAANARVAVEAAELERAKVTQDEAFLRAPFAGVVLRRDAEPGEVVSPANTGGSGSKTAVVTLADFSTLEVEVDVYERDIGRIEVGSPCRVVLDAWQDRPLEASVRLVRPTADRARSTIQVYVAFKKVPEFARPEMVARVTFFVKDTAVLTQDRIFAPTAAIVNRGERRGCFVLRGETVAFVSAEFGTSEANRTEVLSGLRGGDVVVIEPAADLADGERVVVQSE